MVQVNRINRNPSNNPRIISTNINGPGSQASQPEGRKFLYKFVVMSCHEELTFKLHTEAAEEEYYNC